MRRAGFGPVRPFKSLDSTQGRFDKIDLHELCTAWHIRGRREGTTEDSPATIMPVLKNPDSSISQVPSPTHDVQVSDHIGTRVATNQCANHQSLIAFNGIPWQVLQAIDKQVMLDFKLL